MERGQEPLSLRSIQGIQVEPSVRVDQSVQNWEPSFLLCVHGRLRVRDAPRNFLTFTTARSGGGVGRVRPLPAPLLQREISPATGLRSGANCRRRLRRNHLALHLFPFASAALPTCFFVS